MNNERIMGECISGEYRFRSEDRPVRVKSGEIGGRRPGAGDIVLSPPTNEVRLRVALAEAKASQRCCLRHSMPAGAASRYALGAGGVGAVHPAPAASLISASRYCCILVIPEYTTLMSTVHHSHEVHRLAHHSRTVCMCKCSAAITLPRDVTLNQV